ncbi:MAG: hypothetical protein IT204_17000 [Fimbriimonadaceae bacterium]|nr:hypothetical protein [Fimbriimonadaceae bacterium]
MMLGLLLGPLAACSVQAPADWPPRELLVRSLVAGVDAALPIYHPQTGRFGSEPWICGDQNVLFPLAVAWSLQDPANPHYHSDRLLQVIAKGGEALTQDQDPQGRWTFRKKDGSTWGQIYMPWTYSRWIRAYQLVGEALPAASREVWERGLRLGFRGILAYMDDPVHNIPCHHAMGLYLAGQAFAEPTWCEAARGMMQRVVATQDPAGFWSEHLGPVIGYNEVYVDALGIYYAASRDAAVLPALERAARFHSNVLWPDGSTVAAIDERQIYHAGREIGNVGFSWTAAGRGYLAQQTAPYLPPGKVVNADWAAAMLRFGGAGSGQPPAAAGDRGRAVIGSDQAVVQRHRPWAWCLSGYACEPLNSRWIQDRQNLLDVYHDDLGLVAGGGNTKLQPYWSTFTVGDPELLAHRSGDTAPNFRPAIGLAWYPTTARLDLADAASTTWAGAVGGVSCGLTVAPRDDSLAVTWRAAGAGRRVEAHLPLLPRKGRLQLADGRALRLDDADLRLGPADLAAGFTYAGLRVTVPPGASLRWPVRQHDPYKKDGSSGLTTARLVLTLPFDDGQGERTVVLSRAVEPPFVGLTFEARELPASSSPGTVIKKLDDLGSLFLGATQIGSQLHLDLPAIPAGRYELLLEFVQAYSYGVVEVALDGQRCGERFDGYTVGVDETGVPVAFGTHDLTGGPHRLTLTIVDRHPQASNTLISLKRVLLRRW